MARNLQPEVAVSLEDHMKVRLAVLASVLCVAASSSAFAGSIDVLVGDKNNFGFADCTDSGTCPDLINPSIDNRTSAEMAATNGAQYTDVYSALLPSEGPNTTSVGDIIFNFTGTLTSATLSIAAGDFQSDSFGAFSASINGFAVPFAFDDGRFVTDIHSITLTPAELAAANSAGMVDLNLNRDGSGDFVAFDWFELTGTTGNTSPVPEPFTLSLFGAGLAGAAAMRRRKKVV
jgi:hypothetical protein